MTELHGAGQEVLSSVESSVMQLTPGKCCLRREKISHWFNNISNSRQKLPEKIYHSQEPLYFLLGGWGGERGDCVDIGGQRADALRVDPVSKKVDFFLRPSALPRVDGQTVVSQQLEHKAEVL